jgi:viroplasmin and RNaseH domain-containing protein
MPGTYPTTPQPRGQTLIEYENRRGRRTVVVGAWDEAAAQVLCARLRALPTCQHALVLVAGVTLIFSELNFQQAVDTLMTQP